MCPSRATQLWDRDRAILQIGRPDTTSLFGPAALTFLPGLRLFRLANPKVVVTLSCRRTLNSAVPCLPCIIWTVSILVCVSISPFLAHRLLYKCTTLRCTMTPRAGEDSAVAPTSRFQHSHLQGHSRDIHGIHVYVFT
ncbi:hypothetical protein ABW21_db0203882 [Orbilia brochopaga]|nr:hypothetical protein ABW21_db0203882 [Drechslerella brochopaga]